MALNINFIVTDYQAIRPGSQSQPSLNYDTLMGGYTIKYRSNERMKLAQPYSGTIDGYTNIVSQLYMKNRYMQVITISLKDEKDNFYSTDITEIDEIMDNIDYVYTAKQYPVLYINIIPRQIYLNDDLLTRDYQTAIDIFKRYGFIDIGGYINNLYIPEGIMIRANEIGSAGIVGNMREHGECW